MTGTHSKKYKMAVDGIRAYELYMEFIQEDDARSGACRWTTPKTARGD